MGIRWIGALASAALSSSCSLTAQLDELEGTRAGPEETIELGDASDAGWPTDDASPEAPLPCGALDDSFDDGTPEPLWDAKATSPSSILEIDGEVLVTIGNDASSADFVSRNDYDLRNCAVTIRVPEIPNPSDVVVGAEFFLQDAAQELEDDAEYLAFASFGGALAFVDEAPSPQAIDYPENHRHWRFREQAGQLHWETSLDGLAWNQWRSIPTPSFIASARVGFGGRHATAAAGTGSARFDDLRTTSLP